MNEEVTMKRYQVEICAVNDDSSDAPIVYMFDGLEVRAKFLASVRPRYGEFDLIDGMTMSDAEATREAIAPITNEVLEHALASGNATEYFEEHGYRFYDCCNALQDVRESDFDPDERRF